MSEEKPKLTGLDLLRSPFPEHQISLKPVPTKKDNPKGKCSECGGWHGLPAVHLEYVGHAALTNRLLDSDPDWNWEPLHIQDGLPHFDKSGGLWIKLTVCGKTRLGYGNAEESNFKEIGSREKEVIGDALRNAAMRFGAALDLWHKGNLNPEDEKPEEKQVQKTESLPPPQKPKPPVKNHVPASTAQLKRMFAIANEKKIDVTTNLKAIIGGMFGASSTKDLSAAEVNELCDLMNKEDENFILRLAADIQAKRESNG